MRDSDLEATLEADRKASESFLNHSTLQLESSLMCHDGKNAQAPSGFIVSRFISLWFHFHTVYILARPTT
jgi:hypothetical protein